MLFIWRLKTYQKCTQQKKGLIKNTMKYGKKKLKGISMFNPGSSKIPLGCAIVFWGMAVLMCVFTLLSLTVLHQIVSEHQHYPETGRDTMELNNLFSYFYLPCCGTSGTKRLCVHIFIALWSVELVAGVVLSVTALNFFNQPRQGIAEKTFHIRSCKVFLKDK